MAEINTEIISNTIGLISFSDIKQLLEIDDDIADIFGNFFGFLSQGQKDTIDEISMIHSEEIPISASANGTAILPLR